MEGISTTRADEKAVFHANRGTATSLHLYVFFASPGKDAFTDNQYFNIPFYFRERDTRPRSETIKR